MCDEGVSSQTMPLATLKNRFHLRLLVATEVGGGNAFRCAIYDGVYARQQVVHGVLDRHPCRALISADFSGRAAKIGSPRVTAALIR